MNNTKTQQNRKTFFKTLGFIGAGTLLSSKISAFSQSSVDNKWLSVEKKNKVKPLRVAHLTDIHVCQNTIARHGFEKALKEVNNASHPIDFIINGGDAILNQGEISKTVLNSQWKTFHNVLSENNSIPVKHCIGNHDLYSFVLPDKTHSESKKWALAEYRMPKPYYSFLQGGWKFIVLDSIHGRNSLPGYYGKIDEEQFLWLETELRNTPPEIFICIVSHIPILAICTIFESAEHDHKSWRVPDNCLHADAIKLTKLFYEFKNIKVCLSGHIHLIDHVNYLGIDYYCNGAVAGSWWKGNYHQFAPAYAIHNFYPDGTCTRDIKYYQWN